MTCLPTVYKTIDFQLNLACSPTDHVEVSYKEVQENLMHHASARQDQRALVQIKLINYTPKEPSPSSSS